MEEEVVEFSVFSEFIKKIHHGGCCDGFFLEGNQRGEYCII
jgi:hypothetical protein